MKQKKVFPIKEIFSNLTQFYISIGKNNHDTLTRTLYDSFSDLLNEIRQLSEKDSEISQFKTALESFLKIGIFNIHIKETIHLFKDCCFKEAFYHFHSLIESDWNLLLSEEMKGILKFLYGIFLLNVRDFEFFNHLFKSGFWDNYSHINQIFQILSEIREKKKISLEIWGK